MACRSKGKEFQEVRGVVPLGGLTRSLSRRVENRTPGEEF